MKNFVIFIFTPLFLFGTPLFSLSQANQDKVLKHLEAKYNAAREMAKSDPFSADSLAYEVKDTARLYHYTDLEIRTHILISKIKLVKGRNIRALRFAQSALDLSKEKGTKKNLATSMINIALMFKEMGSLNKAIDFETQAFDIFNELNDDEGMLKALTALTETYTATGEYEKALSHVFKALKAAIAQKNKLLEAKVLASLGTLYGYMQKLDKAKEHLSKSRDIFIDLDDKRGLARIHNDMGNIGFYSGDTGYAIENYNLALEINTALKDINKIMLNYGNLTALYGQMGDMEKAKFYLDEARKVVPDSAQTIPERVQRLVNLAGILTIEGNADEAIVIINDLIPMAKKSNLKSILLDVYFNLAAIHEGLGDHEKAYNAYRMHVVYKDSLESEQIKQDLFLAEARFKIEQNELELKNSQQSLELAQQSLELTQQEKDINALKLEKRNYWIVIITIVALLIIFIIAFLFWKQKVAKAQQANEFNQKKTDLEQRALRASMNPHFIFNALNSIQGLYMERDYSKADDYLADFGKLLRITLENSLKETISIKQELKALRLYLDLERTRTESLFSYAINISEELEDSGIQIPPFIIQPFAENAIWHGILPKNSSGHLLINIEEDETHLLCSVQDNGVGINLNTNSDHNSQGILTTKARLGDDGNVVLKENPEGGTIVNIKIPKR